MCISYMMNLCIHNIYNNIYTVYLSVSNIYEYHYRYTDSVYISNIYDDLFFLSPSCQYNVCSVVDD